VGEVKFTKEGKVKQGTLKMMQAWPTQFDPMIVSGCTGLKAKE
jgi:hypothetical protein